MKKLIKRNKKIFNLYKDIRYFYYKLLFSDKGLIRYRFRRKVGRRLNLKKPELYNDKIQWLKLNWRDSLARICADKFEVRGFVEELIGKEHLNTLYGVYNSVDEIDLEKLPKSFVLKSTHGTGDNIICKDKSNIDWNKAKKTMRKWLKRNVYWTTREWVYKDIKPRIICEKYLSDENGNPPMDYKIFCFHGEPKLIQVDIDRFGDHRQVFYDNDWVLRNVSIGSKIEEDSKVSKPNTLNEMLELSRILSSNFPHVRVDFYNIENRVIFGELTFFHRNGLGKFNPPEFEKELGELLDIENLSNDKTNSFSTQS